MGRKDFKVRAGPEVVLYMRNRTFKDRKKEKEKYKCRKKGKKNGSDDRCDMH